MNKRNPGKLGHAFEKRVVDIFERNGYVLMKSNQWKRNYNPAVDSAKKREFDIVMLKPAFSTIYILECKAHFERTTLVGVGELKEFRHKLDHYNGKHVHPLAVSDTDFTMPARAYAEKQGIYLLNGVGLEQLAQQGSFVGKIKSKAGSGVLSFFEDAFDDMLGKYF